MVSVTTRPVRLVYVNSGDDRVQFALDRRGEVALDSGRVGDLDQYGAVFGPDGRYYVGLRRRRTIPCPPPPVLGHGAGEAILPDGIGFPFLGVFGFGGSTVSSIWLLRRGIFLQARATTRSPCSTTTRGELCAHPGSWTTPSSSPLDLVLRSERQHRGQQRVALLEATRRDFQRPRNTTTPPGRWRGVLAPDPTIGFARPHVDYGSDPTDVSIAWGQDHVIAFDFLTQGPTSASPYGSQGSTVRLFFYGTTRARAEGVRHR